MTLIHGTIDIFIYTFLAISAPSVALWLRSRKPPTIPIPRPPLRTPLTVLVVLHTLYTLYTLIYHQPPNIFTSLDIPISTPTAHIRTVFLEHAAHDPTMTLSPSLDALITRLNSFDVRTVFIRCATIRYFAFLRLCSPEHTDQFAGSGSRRSNRAIIATASKISR